MAKRIDWLEQFANDQYKQMTKTASREKIANQIIVDRSSYPNAKVGSLIDFDNAKYKVVDTKYHDKSGPGLLLEEITASLDTSDGEVKPVDGTIPATSTEQSANCGDCCVPPTKTAQRIGKEIIAAKDDDDFDLDLSDLNFDDDDKDDKGTSINDVEEKENNDFDALANFDDSKIDVEEDSEYPSIIPRPGGVKPMPSAPIEGPGKKNVTDAPYHPTYDPGEQYALESLDEWQDAADRTAKAIEQEDAQDRTTVEGHYTWNQYIDAMLDGNDSNTVNEGLNFADNNTEFDSATETEEDNLDISDEDTNDEDFNLDTDVDTADDVDTAVDDILGKDDEDNDSDLDIPDEFNSEENADTDIDADIDTDISADEDLDFNTDTDTTDIDNNDFGTESDFDNDEDFSNDEEEEDLELPAIDIDEEKKEASNKSNARPLSRLAYKNR